MRTARVTTTSSSCSCDAVRRHLTGSQRSAAIVACSEWHPAHREKKSVVATDFRAPTSAQLAKEADVSVSTITHAKAAHTAGVGNAVRDGRITAERGAQIAKLPVAERAAAISRERAHNAAATSASASCGLAQNDLHTHGFRSRQARDLHPLPTACDASRRGQGGPPPRRRAVSLTV